MILTPQGKWDDTCIRCSLHQCRGGYPPLFLQGAAPAKYLIVTEAPSIEDLQSGYLNSGQKLDIIFELLNESGIDTNTVCFTALVACPSYKIIPAGEDDEGERIAYQSPRAEEIAACEPRLNEVIYRIDPRLIITFGTPPWKNLVSTQDRKRKNTITECAGDIFDVWIRGRGRDVRYPLLGLLPVEQIISNPSRAAHGPAAQTLAALTTARHYVTKLEGEEAT